MNKKAKSCYNCSKNEKCKFKKYFEKMKINSCPDYRVKK
jgi:hypothetical protein